MTIKYQDFYLEVIYENELEGNLEVNFKLYTFSNNGVELLLWESQLEGLWEDEDKRETIDLKRVWNMHIKGDYFQQTIFRHNRTLHPNTSYTAVFQEIIRENPLDFMFINNIYSTSILEWLSMGYKISINAIEFWNKQVENRLAIYVDEEQRYKAIL